MNGHHWPAGQQRDFQLNTKARIFTSRPLEKGAFFVAPGQALQELDLVLSALTSHCGSLNRDGNAAKPVFSRPCSCHGGNLFLGGKPIGRDVLWMFQTLFAIGASSLQTTPWRRIQLGKLCMVQP